jgi:putative DNA primase/helicase
MSSHSSQVKKTSKSKLQPIPDPTQVLRHIKMLHGSKPTWFLKFDKKGSTPSCGSDPQLYGTATHLLDKLTAANAERYNIAVAVNQIGPNSRTNDNVRGITAVFIDVDNGRTTKADLMNLPLSPNLIVETSPGRLHAYWLVSNCSVQKFKRVQRALAHRFDSDRQVCDPARVMRLPGSINWNHGSPFLTQIIHEVERSRVPVAKLIRELGLKPEAPAKSRTSGQPAAPSAVDGNTATTPRKSLTDKMKAQIRQALATLPADDRNTWLRAGMAIHSVNASEKGYQLWTAWSKTGIKFDEAVQRKTWQEFKVEGGINIHSLFWLSRRAGAASSFDDMDAAQLFATTFKGKLRFDPQMGLWYEFDTVVWRADKQAPMRAARSLVADLSEGEGKSDASVKKLRSHAGMTGMVKLAELETVLHISENQFDQDANLLAVSNGVIDLRTGQFRAAKAKDYLRRRCDVAFDADAKCPRWTRFIADVTCGDKKLAGFLQRALGYTVFGHTKAQAFFAFEGTGENGKGVFMRTMTAILGDYATELAPNLVTSAYAGAASQANSALMALKGKRFAISTELPESRGFDTAFVKQFAGGDSITTRANYGDTITFKPEAKLWLSTNEMPEIRANDKAMWRRIFPVPFNGNFSGANRDDDVEEHLLKETAGILNWVLRGAKRYHAQGKLQSCPAVEDKKRSMRKESDTLGAWVADWCVTGQRESLQASKAYGSYCDYTKRLGRHPLTQKAFHIRMESAGYVRRKGGKFNSYLGLDLRATAGKAG